jgi:hypothetical protein
MWERSEHRIKQSSLPPDTAERADATLRLLEAKGSNCLGELEVTSDFRD